MHNRIASLSSRLLNHQPGVVGGSRCVVGCALLGAYAPQQGHLLHLPLDTLRALGVGLQGLGRLGLVLGSGLGLQGLGLQGLGLQAASRVPVRLTVWHGSSRHSPLPPPPTPTRTLTVAPQGTESWRQPPLLIGFARQAPRQVGGEARLRSRVRIRSGQGQGRMPPGLLLGRQPSLPPSPPYPAFEHVHWICKFPL